MSAAKSKDAPPAGRHRGRPPKSEAEVGKTRERIIEATRRVFARVGYHGLSAELIIEEAGISRPTFYKYFRSTEEPVEVLVSQVNDDLIARLMAAVAAAPDPLAKVESAILAWRQWGEDLGEFLRPFFAELNNPATPVGRHRQQTLTLLTGQIAGIIELLGHARPGDLRVATFLHSIEFLGYHFHLNTPRDDASWQETRTAMFRLALGLLGSAEHWGRALALAGDWHIDLNRH